MIEIDQSRKIERTSKDTVLAMSNLERSLVIPARVKREVLAILKRRGKTRNIACCQLFAIGVFILLRPHLKTVIEQREQIMIDTEYTAHEDKIKGMILRCSYHDGYSLPKERIFFAQVGKASRAHKIAWQVQRGIIDADGVVTLEEVLQWL